MKGERCERVKSSAGPKKNDRAAHNYYSFVKMSTLYQGISKEIFYARRVQELGILNTVFMSKTVVHLLKQRVKYVKNVSLCSVKEGK